MRVTTHEEAERLDRLYSRALRPREAVADARDWLLDCFTNEDSQVDIRVASVPVVVRGVERYYAGGWLAFLEAGDNLRVAR